MWLQVDILMSDREKALEAQDAMAKADPNAGVPAMQVSFSAPFSHTIQPCLLW